MTSEAGQALTDRIRNDSVTLLANDAGEVVGAGARATSGGQTLEFEEFAPLLFRGWSDAAQIDLDQSLPGLYRDSSNDRFDLIPANDYGSIALPVVNGLDQAEQQALLDLVEQGQTDFAANTAVLVDLGTEHYGSVLSEVPTLNPATATDLGLVSNGDMSVLDGSDFLVGRYDPTNGYAALDYEVTRDDQSNGDTRYRYLSLPSAATTPLDVASIEATSLFGGGLYVDYPPLSRIPVSLLAAQDRVATASQLFGLATYEFLYQSSALSRILGSEFTVGMFDTAANVEDVLRELGQGLSGVIDVIVTTCQQIASVEFDTDSTLPDPDYSLRRAVAQPVSAAGLRNPQMPFVYSDGAAHLTAHGETLLRTTSQGLAVTRLWRLVEDYGDALRDISTQLEFAADALRGAVVVVAGTDVTAAITVPAAAGAWRGVRADASLVRLVELFQTCSRVSGSLRELGGQLHQIGLDVYSAESLAEVRGILMILVEVLMTALTFLVSAVGPIAIGALGGLVAARLPAVLGLATRVLGSETVAGVRAPVAGDVGEALSEIVQVARVTGGRTGITQLLGTDAWPAVQRFAADRLVDVWAGSLSGVWDAATSEAANALQLEINGLVYDAPVDMSAEPWGLWAGAVFGGCLGARVFFGALRDAIPALGRNVGITLTQWRSYTNHVSGLATESGFARVGVREYVDALNDLQRAVRARVLEPITSRIEIVDRVVVRMTADGTTTTLEHIGGYLYRGVRYDGIDDLAAAVWADVRAGRFGLTTTEWAGLTAEQRSGLLALHTTFATEPQFAAALAIVLDLPPIGAVLDGLQTASSSGLALSAGLIAYEAGWTSSAVAADLLDVAASLAFKFAMGAAQRPITRAVGIEEARAHPAIRSQLGLEGTHVDGVDSATATLWRIFGGTTDLARAFPVATTFGANIKTWLSTQMWTNTFVLSCRYGWLSLQNQPVGTDVATSADMQSIQALIDAWPDQPDQDTVAARALADQLAEQYPDFVDHVAQVTAAARAQGIANPFAALADDPAFASAFDPAIDPFAAMQAVRGDVIDDLELRLELLDDVSSLRGDEFGRVDGESIGSVVASVTAADAWTEFTDEASVQLGLVLQQRSPVRTDGLDADAFGSQLVAQQLGSLPSDPASALRVLHDFENWVRSHYGLDVGRLRAPASIENSDPVVAEKLSIIRSITGSDTTWQGQPAQEAITTTTLAQFREARLRLELVADITALTGGRIGRYDGRSWTDAVATIDVDELYARWRYLVLVDAPFPTSDVRAAQLAVQSQPTLTGLADLVNTTTGGASPSDALAVIEHLDAALNAGGLRVGWLAREPQARADLDATLRADLAAVLPLVGGPPIDLDTDTASLWSAYWRALSAWARANPTRCPDDAMARLAARYAYDEPFPGGEVVTGAESYADCLARVQQVDYEIRSWSSALP